MKIFMAHASDYGLSAVMLHVYEEKTARLISFTSKTFSTVERKYTGAEMGCPEIIQ